MESLMTMEFMKQTFVQGLECPDIGIGPDQCMSHWRLVLDGCVRVLHGKKYITGLGHHEPASDSGNQSSQLIMLEMALSPHVIRVNRF